MKRNWVHVPVALEKVRHWAVERVDEGGERWLSVSDMPVSFEVSGNRETRVVSIRVVYASGDSEPVHWADVEAHGIRFALGQYSRRLLRIELKIGDNAQPDVRALIEALNSALRELRDRARHAGPRMNYAVAAAGLTVDADTSPPWLVETLDLLRREQTDSTR